MPPAAAASPPYVGACADAAGTFSILLDWENGTGRLAELNDQLVNYHHELWTPTGIDLQLANPPSRSHGIIPSYNSLSQSPGQFGYLNGVGRLISDGIVPLPGGVSRIGEPYDITFGLHQATFNMTVRIIDWYITVTNAPAVFARAIVVDDHNRDGIVDAADYVVWRKTGVGSAGHAYWQENFGHSSGGGGNNGSTPEPTTLLCAVIGASLFASSHRSKCRRR